VALLLNQIPSLPAKTAETLELSVISSKMGEKTENGSSHSSGIVKHLADSR
jgi:hypothetical protein